MHVTRRLFLTAASGLAVGTRLAASSVQGANDRVRVGIIGTGGRARGLMTQLKTLPGAEIVAVCDVYEPRLLQAAEIAGAGVAKVSDYRRVLDDRGIDAVLVGTPDHWHKRVALDAVAAGKDVYVEKPVSHTIEEGVEMVKAIEASKQVVQTGTQQRSWDHWILGKQIVDSGRLGQITFVHTYLVPARPRRQLRAGRDGQARLEAMAGVGARPAVPARVLLPVASLLELRRRPAHRSDDALD